MASSQSAGDSNEKHADAVKHSHSNKTYAEALSIIDALPLPSFDSDANLPLHDVLGRVAARDVLSPLSTPPFNASAMDGFALPSNLTSRATQSTPIRLEVLGMTAAGDPPFDGREAKVGKSCVEIMTGARMPLTEVFDAVVRIEDTLSVSDGDTRFIEIRTPVAPRAHVRLSGDDFSSGQLLLRKGETLSSKHILALASVGISHVYVLRNLRVGVWSTGKEVCSSHADGGASTSTIMDANAPYLCATLAEMGIKAEFMGILDDDGVKFRDTLRRIRAGEVHFDVMITTGAVSMGKFDFVPAVLAEEGAEIKFHGLAIRPGHPVLCATIEAGLVSNGEASSNAKNKRTVFFGLPGNPIAAAVCFRFLVTRYLNRVQGREHETGGEVEIKDAEGSPLAILKPTRKIDIFRHGTLHADSSGETLGQVWLHGEQSPSKIRPILASDCFVHTSTDGQRIVHRCFPISES